MTILAGDALEAILARTGRTGSVEQTGGNTATLFVPAQGTSLLIGPGQYNWTDPDQSEFDTRDLYVGWEDQDDDFDQVYTLDELVESVDRWLA